jgi:hypothetical protein
MKGGIPPTDKAIELNSTTLCEYQDLTEQHREGVIDEKFLNEKAAELMLYQIKLSNEYPNPISIADIVKLQPNIQFFYIDGRVKCSGTVM